MEIKLFLDKHGYPRAKVSKSCKVLSSFLEEEIQSDKEYGKELIEVIDDIKKGKLSNWEETGNANTLILQSTKAIIENEFTNAMGELSLDDLRQAILDWLVFVEKL